MIWLASFLRHFSMHKQVFCFYMTAYSNEEATHFVPKTTFRQQLALSFSRLLFLEIVLVHGFLYKCDFASFANFFLHKILLISNPAFICASSAC